MRLFALLAAFTCLGALADDAALRRCRAITDNTARLACYDAVTLPPPPGVARTPAPAPVPAADPNADFGRPPQVPAAALDAIESQIVGEFEEWRPKRQIRLTNGQVWRIADDSSGICYCDNGKVRIRRGALGAFYIEFPGQNASPRVVRVR